MSTCQSPRIVPTLYKIKWIAANLFLHTKIQCSAITDHSIMLKVEKWWLELVFAGTAVLNSALAILAIFRKSPISGSNSVDQLQLFLLP